MKSLVKNLLRYTTLTVGLSILRGMYNIGLPGYIVVWLIAIVWSVTSTDGMNRKSVNVNDGNDTAG